MKRQSGRLIRDMVQADLNQSVAQNFPDFSSALTVQKVIEACEVVGRPLAICLNDQNSPNTHPSH
jgi:hypothetical protein